MEPRADGCCIRLNRKFDRIRCSRTIIIIIMLRAQLVETSVFRIELISSFHEKVVEKKRKNSTNDWNSFIENESISIYTIYFLVAGTSCVLLFFRLVSKSRCVSLDAAVIIISYGTQSSEPISNNSLGTDGGAWFAFILRDWSNDDTRLVEKQGMYTLNRISLVRFREEIYFLWSIKKCLQICFSNFIRTFLVRI